MLQPAALLLGGVNFFFFSHFRELPDFCPVCKASSVISVHILYHSLFHQLLLVLQKNFGGSLHPPVSQLEEGGAQLRL